ncbi:hypothetical protein BZA70DRAFT_278689 [Myxozyma melibiosi]|uniref:ferric-chelate reductase (NADPH) n=1 Tax=Myxozyma melibiosi TaxID=54550 RepID=A0ABR1F518_9ASCO
MSLQLLPRDSFANEPGGSNYTATNGPSYTNQGQGQFNLDGTPRPGYIAKMYWAVIGAVLAFAFLLRFIDLLLAHQRLRSRSAKPRLFFIRAYASLTVVGRVLSYPTLPWIQRFPNLVHFPSTGRLIMALSYFGLLIGLCFYNLPRSTSAEWEQAGYRAAWLAITQIPLITLLSCRRLTVIAFLTGSSSSVSLNFFHRWVSRGFFMIAAIHMFYMMRYYESFNYLSYQLKTDPITKDGLRSFCILAWIVIVTSVRPIRHYLFELFFVNHIASVIAFLVILMRHTPTYAHVYLWISIGIIVADAALRWVLLFINNVSTRGLKYRATITSIADTDMMKISIPIAGSARLLRWKPGQFVNLSFPTYGPLMSHPFSVMSTSDDQSLEFIVKKKTGITRWIHKSAAARASSFNSSPESSYASDSLRSDKRGSTSYNSDAEMQSTAMSSLSGLTLPVLVDGPYGGSPRDLKQFASVLNVFAGVGATYGLPVARGLLLDAAKAKSVALKNIELVWIVRQYADVFAFKETLQLVSDAYDLCDKSIQLSIRIFVSDISSLPADGEDEEKSTENFPPCVTIVPGKPNIRHVLADAMTTASPFGELAVNVCGGLRLAADVKNSTAILLDARAAHTGSNGTAQSCYVHVEQFEG